jgi:class 3 adenylate cyclase
MADKALIGFLKVLVEAHRDRQLVGYRSDPRLKDSSGAFQLRMGFGLHCGWAIEGAVGSIQKVDATYLSPHVNMTARMEAATRQYKLAILMTQQFHEVCIYLKGHQNAMNFSI